MPYFDDLNDERAKYNLAPVDYTQRSAETFKVETSLSADYEIDFKSNGNVINTLKAVSDKDIFSQMKYLVETHADETEISLYLRDKNGWITESLHYIRG